MDQRVLVGGDTVRYLAADGSILTYRLPAEGDEALPLVGGSSLLHRLIGGGWTLAEPAYGRLLVFTPLGDDVSVLSDVLDADVRWSIERDESGVPTRLRSSFGAAAAFLSSGGLLTELRLPDGDGDPQPVYRFDYDDDRNLVAVVNADEEAERFDYAGGRLVRWEDRNGEWYGYTYDEAGRCVATDGKGGYLKYQFAYAEGLTVAVDSLGAERRYRLNERLQVIAETDALGATTVSQWDDANRLRSRTDPLGRTTTYDYTADGRPTAIVRPDGSRSTISYDAEGRAVSWTDFDGGVRQRAFGDDGLLLAEIDAGGEVVSFERPNEAGPGTIVQTGPAAVVRDAIGRITAIAEGGHETRYAYDGLGRVVTIEDDRGRTDLGWTIEGKLAWRDHPDHTVEEFVYDSEGNLVAAIGTDGRVTEWRYGPFDLVTAEIDSEGNRTGYEYDTELRLTTITTPDGRTHTYEYDANGRKTAETDAGGRTQRYTYDAAGQLVEHTDASGKVTTYTYDMLGRAKQR